MIVELRDIVDADMDVIFEFERDPEAVRMAAFTRQDPDDRDAFDKHWQRILADPLVINRAIEADGELVGTIASYVMEGDREVTYWVGRAHWGRGIASQALALLLQLVTERPLWGRAVDDNVGSLRVLQRAGFVVVDDDHDFAPGRGTEVRELILRLDA
jgi:RimJ/RimL family protein N-acetyltransferase